MGLVIAIILAWRFPNVGRKKGVIRAEWSIKWGKQRIMIASFCLSDKQKKKNVFLGAVIIIFLISGLSLRTRILAQTLFRIRLHLLIQVTNLVLIPFFVIWFGLFVF